MIVNMVPVFGGTIAVALTVALNHKLDERRERWFTELAEAVEELRDRFEGFAPESLAENDAFVDAVVTATRIVDRTSQREKSRCCATRCSTQPCRPRPIKTSSSCTSP
jgi:hypothetical protein